MNAATQAMNDATQRMADFAYAQTWLVGVGTALLFVTLWLTWQANKAAQAAVAVTREMGMKQVRAYLFCESVSIDWAADRDSIRHVVLMWKNSGLSPASSVQTWAALCVLRPAAIADEITEDDLEEIERLYEVEERYLYIPPNGTTKNLLRPIPTEELAAWRRGDCAILAYGITWYVDEFNEHRISRCCYRFVYEDTPEMHITHFERFRIGNQ